MADLDLTRLCKSIRHSRRVLERFRTDRVEAVKQYIGYHWGDARDDKKVVLVNMISQYIQIITRSLIAKNPRYMLSTMNRQLRPPVSAMESWANDEVESMNLAETIRRIVVDAQFDIGIAKVALSTPSDAAQAAWNMQAGKPFVESIDLDDLAFDAHARHFDEVSFIGHRLRVPLDTITDSKLYSRDRKNLTASQDEPYNMEGDERINRLGQGFWGEDDDFEPMVDLWEIYLPRSRQVMTLKCDGAGDPALDQNNDPLREQPWVGPDRGPYYILSYGIVPGNAMPKGPISDLVDLHEAVNRIYRKSVRQADRQKEVLPVRSAGTDDGKRMLETNDGEACRHDGEPPKPVLFGGVNQQNLQFGIHLRDVFSRQAGNLDATGGLAPQAKTATQDKMLSEAASMGVADMQERTVEFVSNVGEGLCWYWWHDPHNVQRTTFSAPGTPEIAIPRAVGPAGMRVDPETGRPMRLTRSGKWKDLRIKVDPYSMQHSTPQSRLMALNGVIQQIVLPMMPILQQQGVAFDINAYLQKVAKYLDMPDIDEIITMSEPVQPEQQGAAEAPGMAPETTRNYVRRSLGGDTPEAREAVLSNMAPGITNGQPSQNGER